TPRGAAGDTWTRPLPGGRVAGDRPGRRRLPLAVARPCRRPCRGPCPRAVLDPRSADRVHAVRGPERAAGSRTDQERRRTDPHPPATWRAARAVPPPPGAQAEGPRARRGRDCTRSAVPADRL